MLLLKKVGGYCHCSTCTFIQGGFTFLLYTRQNLKVLSHEICLIYLTWRVNNMEDLSCIYITQTGSVNNIKGIPPAQHYCSNRNNLVIIVMSYILQ